MTRLFALPYAGGGASVYRAWARIDTSSGLVVHGVQLPGREELFTEPWPRSVADTVGLVLDQLDAVRDDGDRVALFGHSFGAVLAYEATRALVRRGEPPVHLFASGAVAPTASLRREDSAEGLGDDEFVARVEKLAGYTHPALLIPDLREVVLPVLRADVVMHEAYRAEGGDPLPVPVTALRGTDDHLVTADDCAAWAEVTTRGCRVADLAGGHMYFVDDPLPLLRLVGETLAGTS